MASIQSLGVGSGLDVNAIVTQLLAIEKQPLQRLIQAESGVQAKVSAYGNIRSKLDALENAAQALKAAESWSQTTVDIGTAQEFSITSTGDAVAGSMDIEVTQLARKQTTAFRGAVGNFMGAAPAMLTFGSSNVSVNPGDSLEDIRDAINALGPSTTGVRAAVMSDVDGSVLALTSVDSGTAASFAVTVTDASLSAFLGTRTDSSAQNLQVKVNGVTLSSASNTLSGVVEGLTITASQLTSGPRVINVGHDLDATKSRISNFVNSYNDVMALLRQQTAYNESTKTAGLLQGDRVAVNLQSQIRSAMTGSTSASSVFSRLSDLGISLQSDGKLQIDDDKLASALENLDELSKLFSRDETGESQDGVGIRVVDLIEQLTANDGGLASRQEGLQNELQRNRRDQDRTNDRLAQIEARLKAQYSALDTRMASLTGLGQYVSQQIQQYNNQK